MAKKKSDLEQGLRVKVIGKDSLTTERYNPDEVKIGDVGHIETENRLGYRVRLEHLVEPDKDDSQNGTVLFKSSTDLKYAPVMDVTCKCKARYYMSVMPTMIHCKCGRTIVRNSKIVSQTATGTTEEV